MNNALRTIVLAAPLATAAFAFGTPAMAQPGDAGPKPPGCPHPAGIVIANDDAPRRCIPDEGHPIPRPPCPPTHDCTPDDDPGDEPGDGPKCPAPTHNCDGDKDGPGDGDEPGDGDDTPGDDTPGDDTPGDDSSDGEVNDFRVPTRIDTGAGGSTSDGGIELAWILAGGALITVSGAAFAGRSMARGRS